MTSDYKMKTENKQMNTINKDLNTGWDGKALMVPKMSKEQKAEWDAACADASNTLLWVPYEGGLSKMKTDDKKKSSQSQCNQCQMERAMTMMCANYQCKKQAATINAGKTEEKAKNILPGHGEQE